MTQISKIGITNSYQQSFGWYKPPRSFIRNPKTGKKIYLSPESLADLNIQNMIKEHRAKTQAEKLSVLREDYGAIGKLLLSIGIDPTKGKVFSKK